MSETRERTSRNEMPSPYKVVEPGSERGARYCHTKEEALAVARGLFKSTGRVWLVFDRRKP